MIIELKNRGSLYVYIDDKYIRLTGELSAGPNYTFYADIVSLDYWVTGIGKIKIKENEKEKIIQDIQKEGEKIKLKILFD